MIVKSNDRTKKIPRVKNVYLVTLEHIMGSSDISEKYTTKKEAKRAMIRLIKAVYHPDHRVGVELDTWDGKRYSYTGCSETFYASTGETIKTKGGVFNVV